MIQESGLFSEGLESLSLEVFKRLALDNVVKWFKNYSNTTGLMAGDVKGVFQRR